jgi:hypothetical protein
MIFKVTGVGESRDGEIEISAFVVTGITGDTDNCVSVGSTSEILNLGETRNNSSFSTS